MKVYRAKLDGVTDVAVKVLKPDAASKASVLQNFVAEVDILRACRHPHIVNFVGAWADEVSPYFCAIA